MGTNKADVTVHLDETLSGDRIKEVCNVIEGATGVEKVRCAEHSEHLLIVEYDPTATDSKQILNKVTDQGLHAELIGL